MNELKDKVIQRESAKPGMRGKVNAKCAECIYDPIGGQGTWRQQIEACSAFICPLHAIRPTSSTEASE